MVPLIRCLVLALFALAAGCASKPQPVLPKPVIRTIALIPATEPRAYTLSNVNAVEFLSPLVGTVIRLDARDKQGLFNERMRARKPALARSFNDAVIAAMRAYGYEVRVLEIARDPESPDWIDWQKLRYDADAVMHVALSEAGLHSPRSSTDYLPRLNAYATLTPKGHEDYLVDQEMYYGLDAKKGSEWSLAADPAFAYDGFNTLINKLDDVQARFDRAARQLAERLAAHTHAQIR